MSHEMSASGSATSWIGPAWTTTTPRSSGSLYDRSVRLCQRVAPSWTTRNWTPLPQSLP